MIDNPPPGISVQNLPTITSSTPPLTSNTIYIAPAGGLSLSGSDSITGTNVMIFVPSGSINLTGTGSREPESHDHRPLRGGHHLSGP